MQDQMNFGNEFISEEQIIRDHYKRIGSKGGKVRGGKKAEAARKNAKLAVAARIMAAKRVVKGR